MAKKKIEEIVATGRRKTAVASIRLRKGKGKVHVNGRPFDEYFPSGLQRDAVLAPFKCVGRDKDYDLLIRVKGGGLEGQAIACRLGLSRALVLENDMLRDSLKERGFLTRDPRRRERKKYGLRGARRAFQFSKR